MSEVMERAVETTVLVQAKALKKAVGIVGKVIPKRFTSNPAISAVQVRARRNGITLSGTNLEADVFVDVPGEAALDFTAFGIPLDALSGFVKGVKDGMVTIETDGNAVTLKSGGARTKVGVIEAERLPDLKRPTVAPEGALRIEALDLASRLTSARAAAAAEEFRAIFRGVQVELLPSRVRFVATDGFRLHLNTLPDGFQSSLDQKVVVNAKNIDALTGILTAVKGQASLWVPVGIIPVPNINPLTGRVRESTEERLGPLGTLAITGDGFAVGLKIMDGELPDYERVLPKDVAVSFRLDPKPAIEVLKGAVRGLGRGAQAYADFAQPDRIPLEGEGDFGEKEWEGEIFPLGPILGDPARLEGAPARGYRPQQLVDALAGATGEVLVRVAPNDNAPTVITDAHGYLAVVVPLRNSIKQKK